MAEHNKLGNKGEQMAQDYLRENDYQILHTNWRYKHKEIDIVAKKDSFLCIVEVKTRTAGGQQTPQESITMSKMRYLMEAADAYVVQFGRQEEVRFDVLAITVGNGKANVEHIPDAFNAMEIS